MIHTTDPGFEACRDPRRGWSLPSAHVYGSERGYVIVAFGERRYCYPFEVFRNVRGQDVYVRTSGYCAGKPIPGARP